MSARFYTLCLLAAGAVLLLPGVADAWGPATHLEISARILQNLDLLPPAVALLLRAHPLDFLYGSIAADVVVGKRFAHYLHHCHRWGVGLEVQGEAATPSQQSFAWGYLSHLSADVVAHNYFVPFKIVQGFAYPGMNHTLWEVRFDTLAPEEVWEFPKNISRRMHLDNDEILKKVLSRQLFSFEVNKVLFNNVVLMGRFRKWHELIRRALHRAGPPLTPERVEYYKALSTEAAIACLCEREDSWCYRADPTGHQCLEAASRIARELRKLFRKGELSRDRFEQVIERYRPHLEASIFTKPNAEELVRATLEGPGPFTPPVLPPQ